MVCCVLWTINGLRVRAFIIHNAHAHYTCMKYIASIIDSNFLFDNRILDTHICIYTVCFV